jgi:hypothetical protein
VEARLRFPGLTTEELAKCFAPVLKSRTSEADTVGAFGSADHAEGMIQEGPEVLLIIFSEDDTVTL